MRISGPVVLEVKYFLAGNILNPVVFKFTFFILHLFSFLFDANLFLLVVYFLLFASRSTTSLGRSSSSAERA
jgi:hypothetical protein